MTITKKLFCVFGFLFSSIFLCSCQEKIKTELSVETPEKYRNLPSYIRFNPPSNYILRFQKTSTSDLGLIKDVNITTILYFSDATTNVVKLFRGFCSSDDKFILVCTNGVEKCEVYGTGKHNYGNKQFKFDAVYP
jgi:hypothetical protein